MYVYIIYKVNFFYRLKENKKKVDELQGENAKLKIDIKVKHDQIEKIIKVSYF